MLISSNLSSILTVSSSLSDSSAPSLQINLILSAKTTSITITIRYFNYYNNNCKSNSINLTNITTKTTDNNLIIIVINISSSSSSNCTSDRSGICENNRKGTQSTTNKQPSHDVHTFTRSSSPSFSFLSAGPLLVPTFLRLLLIAPPKRALPVDATRNNNNNSTIDSGVTTTRTETIETKTRLYDIFAQTITARTLTTTFERRSLKTATIETRTQKHHEDFFKKLRKNIEIVVLNSIARTLVMDSSPHLLTLPNNPSISSAILASDTTTTTSYLSNPPPSASAAQLILAAPLSIGTTTSATMLSSSSPSTIGYSTTSYNGYNATDPYAYSDSRSSAIPVQIQILMCLLYGTLAFTAITSNMIVCYIVLSNQRMRTATNYFIVNLAVGDILMAALCIPFTFPANLIFNYWPFGLSLCVIVSYSQANSVFISAYTMVAISIDKYLAIMYPMRLRMPKIQAKIIILVIWSLALLTSLPTAILSNLASSDSTTSTAPSSVASMSSNTGSYSQAHSTTTSTMSSTTTSASTLTQSSSQSSAFQQTTISTTNSSFTNAALMSQNSIVATTVTPATISLTTTTAASQQQHQEKKYFCQESWTFWPPGKYYYSMALMILQFVLPLFVLVITYSRIVIVVWGKRVPGEEDNARDARMARSKRKMIKMVIFCVIAFALTWLPFNALIVIGDMHPDIWEHQNASYIWFITHYLAMCHTITNPLIYIWMNNRFRVGFKQVMGDLCRPIRQLMLYSCCCCCSLLLLNNDSALGTSNSQRRLKNSRYFRVSSSLSCDQHQQHSQNKRTLTQRTTTSSAGGGAGGGAGSFQIANARPPVKSAQLQSTPTTDSRQQQHEEREQKSITPPLHQQPPPVQQSRQLSTTALQRSSAFNSGCTAHCATPENCSASKPILATMIGTQQQQQYEPVVVGLEREVNEHYNTDYEYKAAQQTVGLARPIDQQQVTATATNKRSGEVAGSSSREEEISSSSTGIGGCKMLNEFHVDVRMMKPLQEKQNRWQPAGATQSASSSSNALAAGTSTAAAASVAAANELLLNKNRRKKRHSHVISIQMTSTEYHKWPSKATAFVASPATTTAASELKKARPMGQLPSNTTTTSPSSELPVQTNAQVKMHKGCKRRSRWPNKRRTARDCPSCQLEKQQQHCNSTTNQQPAQLPSTTATTVPQRAEESPLDLTQSTAPPAITNSTCATSFVADVRRSSQSTATTVSVQTNTTSLAVSPLNSLLQQQQQQHQQKVDTNSVGSSQRLNSSQLMDALSSQQLSAADATQPSSNPPGKGIGEKSGDLSMSQRDNDKVAVAAADSQLLAVSGCKSTTSGSFSCSEQVALAATNSCAGIVATAPAESLPKQEPLTCSPAVAIPTGSSERSYCIRHQTGCSDNNLQQQHRLRNEEQSLETDEDVCCDVFRNATTRSGSGSSGSRRATKLRSRKQQQQQQFVNNGAKTATTCSSNSLEQLSLDQFVVDGDDDDDDDYLNDDDQQPAAGEQVNGELVEEQLAGEVNDDDDEDEDGDVEEEEEEERTTDSLEAEYGDLEQSHRVQALEMVRMSSDGSGARGNHLRDARTTGEDLSKHQPQLHKCCAGTTNNHHHHHHHHQTPPSTTSSGLIEANHLISMSNESNSKLEISMPQSLGANHHHHHHILNSSNLSSCSSATSKTSPTSSLPPNLQPERDLSSTNKAPGSLQQQQQQQLEFNSKHQYLQTPGAQAAAATEEEEATTNELDSKDNQSSSAPTLMTNDQQEPRPSTMVTTLGLNSAASAAAKLHYTTAQLQVRTPLDDRLNSFQATQINSTSSLVGQIAKPEKPIESSTVISAARLAQHHRQQQQPLRQAHSTTALLVRKIPALYLINGQSSAAVQQQQPPPDTATDTKQRQRSELFAATGRAGGSLV